jgi:hypothetical protein
MKIDQLRISREGKPLGTILILDKLIRETGVDGKIILDETP